MELKLLALFIPPPPACRFNRTSVELKQVLDMDEGDIESGFNRTSVELKRLPLRFLLPYQWGLIVPVWN